MEIHNFDFDSSSVNSAHLAEFVTWSSGMKHPVLIWDAEPSTAVSEVFPEYTLQIYLDPLEQPAQAGYDYIVQAQDNIRKLQEMNTELEKYDH